MTILCYHAVQPGWTAPMSVDPAVFAEHVAWLARRRRVVPLAEASRQWGRSGASRNRGVAITFDDGFSSVYEHAFPVLREHGVTATVFLVAKSLVETGSVVDWVDHPPAEPLATLTRDQILEMQAAGVSFESHSYGHADLTRLDYGECVRDLRTSRELLEELLGRPVRQLAYPRGRHDEQVRRAAAEAGYHQAFSLPESREEPSALAIPRVGVHHHNRVRHVRVKTSSPYLAMRTSRPVELLRSRRRPPSPSAARTGQER